MGAKEEATTNPKSPPSSQESMMDDPEPTLSLPPFEEEYDGEPTLAPVMMPAPEAAAVPEPSPGAEPTSPLPEEPTAASSWVAAMEEHDGWPAPDPSLMEVLEHQAEHLAEKQAELPWPPTTDDDDEHPWLPRVQEPLPEAKLLQEPSPEPEQVNEDMPDPALIAEVERLLEPVRERIHESEPTSSPTLELPPEPEENWLMSDPELMAKVEQLFGPKVETQSEVEQRSEPEQEEETEPETESESFFEPEEALEAEPEASEPITEPEAAPEAEAEQETEQAAELKHEPEPMAGPPHVSALEKRWPLSALASLLRWRKSKPAPAPAPEVEASVEQDLEKEPESEEWSAFNPETVMELPVEPEQEKVEMEPEAEQEAEPEAEQEPEVEQEAEPEDKQPITSSHGLASEAEFDQEPDEEWEDFVATLKSKAEPPVESEHETEPENSEEDEEWEAFVASLKPEAQKISQSEPEEEPEDEEWEAFVASLKPKTGKLVEPEPETEPEAPSEGKAREEFVALLQPKGGKPMAPDHEIEAEPEPENEPETRQLFGPEHELEPESASEQERWVAFDPSQETEAEHHPWPIPIPEPSPEFEELETESETEPEPAAWSEPEPEFTVAPEVEEVEDDEVDDYEDDEGEPTFAPEPELQPDPPERLLGEALVARGKLDPMALERAQRLFQDTPNEKFANLLITLGLVAPLDVAEALAGLYKVPLVRADQFPELPILEDRISTRFLREAKVLPLHEHEDELTLAMVDPSDTYTIDAVKMATGKNIAPRVALPSEIETALERLYGAGRSAVGQIVGDIGIETDEFGLNADVQQLKDLASEAPVIRLVSLIITNALSMRASDIHIEPFEDRLIVRYRIDGVLHEIESPPKRLSAAVISRVKIIANLDIAERRLPQDGRIRLRTQGKDIDLRVSTVPTMHGESVVMRILDKGGVALDFHKLGFSEKTLDRFLTALMQPNGILLVTGPTGSGKTTTLYTALDRLNQPDVKILTVEDPVEYQMPGINQIQVKPQIDLTFANALRSIVRQDPDIIMIGEIRDLETAQIAVQSALTGHLVLSTIHTNDSASTVNRLLDMGMEDYLLTSTVIGIQAQRLVRTLCEHCKEPYTVLPEMVDELGLRRMVPEAQKDITMWHAKGCKECSNTGYMGRVCILEVLLMTDTVRSLVMKHAISGEIKEQAIADGMTTMYEDGLRKALAGVTTIEEVLRATRED